MVVDRFRNSGEAHQSHSWRLGQTQGDTAAEWRRLRLKVTTDDGESEIELDTTGE